MTAKLFDKGIVLAGGAGDRLHPLTLSVNKQLLPVYDKPMVYYPLSVLMLAGIRRILLISTPEDIHCFERLLGDGGQIGLSLQYEVQPKPDGLAQAFLIGREFIGGDRVALVLGDNLFYGSSLQTLLDRALSRPTGATIFAYPVQDPQRFAVVQFNPQGPEPFLALSLEEKPSRPKSRYAAVGLYFYDHKVVDFAASLKPSARGELEITDVNLQYLQRGELYVERMGRGMAWLDAGTHESLAQATQFVQTLQQRQGMKIACLEEIAYRKGFIDAGQLQQLACSYSNDFRRYLLEVLDEDPANSRVNGP